MARAKGPSGQVLPIAVAIGVVLVAVCVLTIDVGYVFCKRAQLQNGSDAASIAALQELVHLRRAGIAEEEARAAAAAEGLQIAAANSRDARAVVTFGTYQPDSGFSAADVDGPVDACMVRMHRDDEAPGGPLRLLFAPLLGMSTARVAASAVAAASSSITRVHGNLAPFCAWEGDLLPEGEEMVFYPSSGQGEVDHETGQPTIIPGAFGLLDFNGGANSTTELIEWIRNGYDGDFGVDPDTGCVLIDGDTGFRAGLESAITQRLGEEMVVCVYDDVWGTGSHGTFQVVAFLSLVLTAVDLNPPHGEPYVKGVVGPLYPVTAADVGLDGVPSRNMTRVVLVQ